MTDNDGRDALTALIETVLPRTDDETDAIRGLRRVTPESQVSVMFQILRALDRGDETGAHALLGALRHIADGWPYAVDDTYETVSVAEFNRRFGIR